MSNLEANYTILHLHTDYSNGTTNVDSVTKYTEYIKKAKELNMKSLAFTEHGNVYGWLSKKKACEKAGIKYIHGCEVYITEHLDSENKVRDNYHTVLLAKNYEGFKEINSLISLANNREDGYFYYTPRISMEDFVGISDNVIVLSACLGSVFGRGTNSARKRYLDYFMEHKDRCFLEIQHHNVTDQIEYNRKLYEISKRTGLKLVTATDTHSLDEKKERGRAILQKAKNIYFGEESGWDLTMKSYEELVESYKVQKSLPMEVVMEAIEMTNIISDMIEPFEIDTSHKYPKMADDPKKEVLRHIIDGINKKGISKYDNAKEYADRIMYEMKVYEHNGAFDFMLLMKDVIDFCDNNGIKIGYGRGSVTGSVIAYLMGITEMDSIKHKLNFERFMSSARVSLSDIDTDIMKNRREEVRDYLFSKPDVYCADIITFNTIALKGAIKDVGRALGMTHQETDSITKSVDTDEARLRREYPEVFEYVDIVTDTIVSVGIHPSGVIVSPIPLNDVVGLYTSKDTPNPISQLSMKEIDSLNFVKLDLLGLRTVEVIARACELADIPMITPDTLDANDWKVWENMREDNLGVFQMEASHAGQYLKKLFSDETMSKIKEVNPNVSYIDLLSMANGAIRPSGSSYRDSLANGEFHDNGHEALNEFLASTNHFLIYQEQIIEFLHKFCGYSLGEADLVRRHIAKKYGTEEDIPKIKAGFIKTMKEQYNTPESTSEELIESFLRIIEDASAYGFSLNHSQAYSYMGYATAWLKYYYPVEFATAFLIVNEDNKDKTTEMIKWCKSKGITISLPKYGKGRSTYIHDKESNTIFKSVSSISGVNKDIGDKLYNFANKYRHLTNFSDIMIKMMEEKVSGKANLLTLAKLGFFRDFGSNGKIVQFIEDIFDGKGMKYDSKYADATKEKRIEILKERWETLEERSFTVVEQVKFEMEYLGYGETIYPDMPNDIYIVNRAEDRSWCVYFNCYNISTGENSTMYMALKHRVGIKKLKDYGILKISETKLDRSGRSWIESFVLLQ